MYSRKHQAEPVPEELTDIWTCASDGCNGWMRDNFAFDAEPRCPLCDSDMVRETRMLPHLTNSNLENKFSKKNVSSKAVE